MSMLPNLPPAYIAQQAVDRDGNPITIAVRSDGSQVPVDPMSAAAAVPGNMVGPPPAPPSPAQEQGPGFWGNAAQAGLGALKDAGRLGALSMLSPVAGPTLWGKDLMENPNVQGAVADAGNAVAGVAKDVLGGIRKTLLPSTKSGGEKDAAEAVKAPQPTAFTAPPGTGGSGAAGLAPQSSPGGELSARFTAPAGGVGGGGGGRLARDEAGMRDIAKREEAANVALMEEGRKAATMEAGYRQQQADLAEKQYQQQQQSDTLRQTAMDAQVKAFRDAAEQITKVNTTIDPDRYWASKTTGQRFAAALGVALGSAGGRGPGENAALQIVQSAISRDIDAQKSMADYQLKKGNANLAAQQTLYGMMREKFGDDAVALKATNAAALGVLDKKLEAAKAGLSSGEMKAKIDAMRVSVQKQLQEKMIDLHKDMDTSARGWAGMQLQRENMMLDYGAKMATSKANNPTKVPAGEAKTIGELEGVNAMLDDLETAYHEKTGLLSFVTKHIPGTPSSRYDDNKLLAAQAIGTPLEGGKLTDSDLKDKYLKLVPDASDSAERARQKLQMLRAMVKTKRDSQISGLHQGGYDTSGFSRDATDKYQTKRKL